MSNNYSNIPEEYLVKHGYNKNDNNRSSNSNNKNINNTQYGKLLKKVKSNSKINIQKDVEKRYKDVIDKVEKIMKDNDYSAEQKADRFKPFIYDLKQRIQKCNGAVKNIKNLLDRVDFEEVDLIDSFKLSTSYSFDNPDPEGLIQNVKKNDFDKVIDRVMYIAFRKNKKELDSIINSWINDKPETYDENKIKKWAEGWPIEIKYWQYWVKLAHQMLSGKINLDNYKVYENIHKLAMDEYSFTRFNTDYNIKDTIFTGSSVSSASGYVSSGSKSDDKKDKQFKKRGKKDKGGKKQRGGGYKSKLSEEEKQKLEQLQLEYNWTTNVGKKKKLKKQIENLKKKAKSGSSSGSRKNMTTCEEEIYRILAGGYKDKGGFDNYKSDPSIWNKICGKLRDVISKSVEHYIDKDNNNFDKINEFSIIKYEFGSINVWPTIFYDSTLNNILTGNLRNNRNVTDMNKIKEMLNVNNNLKGYYNFFNDGNTKEKIAKYLSEKFNKNKKEIANMKYGNFTFKNPFTADKYKNNDKLKDLGSNNKAIPYLEYFNIFSINFIKDIRKSKNNSNNNSKNKNKLKVFNDFSTKKGFNQFKNKLFVGLLEYYHDSSIVLKKIVKELCQKYSIDEKPLCKNENSVDENSSNEKNKEKKKVKRKEIGKEIEKDKSVKKRRKSLINIENTSRNSNSNANNGNKNATKEEINNAKIIVSINDQIKNIIKKAQDSENYDHLNKVADFIKDHEDKLKSMNYANAVKLLNDIRK